MVHYVGLDVSLKQTSICVVNQLGSIVREGVVDSEPEAIAAFVRLNAPGAVRIGLETGPTATWLWSELKQLGLPRRQRRLAGLVAVHPPEPLFQKTPTDRPRQFHPTRGSCR